MEINMPNDNSKSARARKEKYNEYYTTYEHACDEFSNYEEQFRGKTIYCPCDNPRWSNIYRWFIERHKELDITLLCSYFDVDDKDCYWSTAESGKGGEEVMEEMRRKGWNIPNDTKLVRIDNLECSQEYYDKVKTGMRSVKGSYCSRESTSLLERCDIIVTNPPFTITAESEVETLLGFTQKTYSWSVFLDWCINSGKKFLVLGPHDALSLQPVFKRFMEDKFRGGYWCNSKHQFILTDGSLGGPATTWYTNLEVNAFNDHYKSGKKFNDTYKFFDERPDVLFLKCYKDLPDDYYGLFAVPVTAFHRFSKKYFEFVEPHNFCDMKVDGKARFCRVVARRKK